MEKTVSRKVISRIEKMTRTVITKTMAPKWTKLSLVQQVQLAQKMLRFVSMANFRANFLKNFPDDIKDMKREGVSEDVIMRHYWGCPEFVAFWKTLEMGENDLRVLIADAET